MKFFPEDNSIINRKRTYEIPEGTVILSEGERNLDMYKIVSGNVEMYTGYGTENEVLLGLLGPGACFGEFGLLTSQPAIYTIVAYSKVKVLRITEALINEFIEENNEGVYMIMRNMANSMLRMQVQINGLSNDLAKMQEQSEEEVVVQAEDIQKENIRNYAIYGVNEQVKFGPHDRPI